MPGLLTLRPLASAAKASRSAAAKSAASVARENPRDDRVQEQVKSTAPTLIRPRVLRATPLARLVPPFRPPQVPVPTSNPSVTRPKQVSDPLGEAVKAKLRGSIIEAERVGSNCSSGSEHEPNSICLAEMVHDFMEDEAGLGKCGRARCNCELGACNGDVLFASDTESKSSLGGEVSDVLQGLTQFVSSVERSLLSLVTTTVKPLRGEETSMPYVECEQSSTIIRRSAMAALRAAGHNAALCKSRWEHFGGFPGGNYEYIDVVLDGLLGRTERLIVDIEFKGQFEIARPTNLYISLLQVLPSVFVGKADRLQQIVNIMSDAAKRSLKKNGMHLPPWRKPEYLRAKWFSPYRRTTNEVPLSANRNRDGLAIGSTAVRTSSWDSKFVNQMEAHFHKVAHSKMIGREKSYGDLSRFVDQGLQKPQQDDFEGVVRGGNRFRPASDITVAGTDWELPTLNPRNPHKPAKGAGLASVLMRAGLTTSNGEDLQERQVVNIVNTGSTEIA